MKSEKQNSHDLLPCKDCITKVMCKNILEKELKERKTIPIVGNFDSNTANMLTFNVHASISHSIRKKCCIIDEILRDADHNLTFYHTAMELFDILGIKSEDLTFRVKVLINTYEKFKKTSGRVTM